MTPLLAACGTGEGTAGNVRAVAVRTTAPADPGDSGPAGRRVATGDTAPGWTLVTERDVDAGTALPAGTEVVVRAYRRDDVTSPDGAVVADIEVPATMSDALTTMLAGHGGAQVDVAGRRFRRLDGTDTCTLVGRTGVRSMLVASRASCEDLESLVGSLVEPTVESPVTD